MLHIYQGDAKVTLQDGKRLFSKLPGKILNLPVDPMHCDFGSKVFTLKGCTGCFNWKIDISNGYTFGCTSKVSIFDRMVIKPKCVWEVTVFLEKL